VPISIRGRDTPPTVVRGNDVLMGDLLSPGLPLLFQEPLYIIS
jgi:hypothetical protein